MLSWNEIRGYNFKKNYKEQVHVDIPNLKEEVLIHVPGNEPFLGHIDIMEKEDKNSIDLPYIFKKDERLMKLENGIRWVAS